MPTPFEVREPTWRASSNHVLTGLAAIGVLDGGDDPQLIWLPKGEVLHDAGKQVEAVVFPDDCVVSLAVRDGDGRMMDVTTVGREGVVGLPAFLEASVHDTRAVCRVPGSAWRLPIAALDGLAGNEAAVKIIHAQCRAVMTVLMQRLVCSRAHSSDQRCACWLLQTQDRVGRDSFPLTHATLAEMLGVRRATVTQNLASLQQSKAIRSHRGTVTVLNRAMLEALSCCCYLVVSRAAGATTP